jgi:hypothetical protein
MRPEQQFKRLRRSSRWTVSSMKPRPGIFEPAPKRSWGVSGILIATAAVVVAVLVVVGALGLRQLRQDAPNLPAVPTQTPTDTTPTDTPAPTPTATPTASAESARPAPRLPLTCDDLLSVEDAATLLGVSDIRAVDSISSELGAFWGMVRRVPVNQLGGLSCLWSNGVPQNSIVGSADGYVGLSIDLYPDTAEQWAATTTVESSTCNSRTCSGQTLAGSTTIESIAEGVKLGDRSAAQRKTDFTAVIAKIATAVKAAGKPAAAVKRNTPQLPTTCAALLSDAQATTAFGLPTKQGFTGEEGGGGYAGPTTKAIESVGQSSCIYFATSGKRTGYAFIVATLPGAAWVPTEYADADAPSGHSESIVLPGLGAKDAASTHCANPKAFEGCVVDLTIDGNWIEVSGIWKANGGIDPTKDRLQTVKDAATAVIANLKG